MWLCFSLDTQADLELCFLMNEMVKISKSSYSITACWIWLRICNLQVTKFLLCRKKDNILNNYMLLNMQQKWAKVQLPDRATFLSIFVVCLYKILWDIFKVFAFQKLLGNNQHVSRLYPIFMHLEEWKFCK